MFTVEENERLTQVGPGTPMGEVLRRFWVPFLPSADLQKEGSPARVRLLGEDLIAFRNRDGGVGVLDRWCVHRGIDLFYGRNEDCGLRCVYHGWKVELDGRVSDMPNIPRAGPLGDRVRTVAYPTYDDGTLIWAYLGPADVRPSRPPAIWETTPVERRSALRMDAEGNWFQHLEGQIDSSHVAFLHNYVSRGDHLYGDEAAYSDPTPRPHIHPGASRRLTPTSSALGVARPPAACLGGKRPGMTGTQSYPFVQLPFGPHIVGCHAQPPGHETTAHDRRRGFRRLQQAFRRFRVDSDEDPTLTAGGDRHVAGDQEGPTTKHLLLLGRRLPTQQLTDAIGQIFVIGHDDDGRPPAWRRPQSRWRSLGDTDVDSCAGLGPSSRPGGSERRSGS
jgi:phenylpropionate dioxygenase-like ring-hydroxylating dioxygenase large terminal subunit